MSGQQWMICGNCHSCRNRDIILVQPLSLCIFVLVFNTSDIEVAVYTVFTVFTVQLIYIAQ